MHVNHYSRRKMCMYFLAENEISPSHQPMLHKKFRDGEEHEFEESWEIPK